MASGERWALDVWGNGSYRVSGAPASRDGSLARTFLGAEEVPIIVGLPSKSISWELLQCYHHKLLTE